LEHPAATSLLPLDRISKFFVVNYMPNTPVGSTNVNNSKLIKLRATWLSPENQVTLGGHYRGHPPKWSHFFAKIRKHAKYVSTSASSEFRRGAGGQAEKSREPEIAYASARIWPFFLASGPAGYSWIRTSLTRIRPAKEKRNNMTSEIKNTTYIYKCPNISKEYLFVTRPRGPNSNT
jgi:hypothetical protein